MPVTFFAFLNHDRRCVPGALPPSQTSGAKAAPRAPPCGQCVCIQGVHALQAREEHRPEGWGTMVLFPPLAFSRSAALWTETVHAGGGNPKLGNVRNSSGTGIMQTAVKRIFHRLLEDISVGASILTRRKSGAASRTSLARLALLPGDFFFFERRPFLFAAVLSLNPPANKSGCFQVTRAE